MFLIQIDSDRAFCLLIPISGSVVVFVTTRTGWKAPGLTVLEGSRFLAAAATLFSRPAMALWTSHGSFTHR